MKQDRLRILSDALLVAAAVLVTIWSYTGGALISRILASVALCCTVALLVKELEDIRRKK